MKLSALGRESMLWVRYIKLSMILIPIILVTTLEFEKREKTRFGRMITGIPNRLWIFIRLCRDQFFNKDFLNSKYVVVDCEDCRPVGTSLEGLVAFAWICEKMKINVKIKKPNSMVWRHFENDMLINNTNESTHNSSLLHKRKFFHSDVEYFGNFFISSAYGHKILSKLAINPDLERCANQWIADNVKGDWVAVHYRGTDASRRSGLDIDSYITYLKEVIGDQYSIFACSDQAQFIDKMRMAFPGRAFSRDIERSYNESPLHRHDIIEKRKGIDNFNQEKDALIDLLILAKAKLIYTTSSGFVEVAPYFNPQIKIISRRGERRII